MEYKWALDLHTHTVASGHAYSTIREMAKAASEKGLECLGITEHGPKLPGSCTELYFLNLKVVPRELYGVKLLLGAEVNILNSEGKLDLSERELKRLDLVIASLHLPCMKPGTIEENTNAYINAMKNPYVNIIGHPDDGRYPVDYEKLVKAAKEYGVLLEVNNHSLDPECMRQNAWENDTTMLKLCMKYQVPVIVDSDAHFDALVAELPFAEKLLKELDFPQELVVNRSREILEKYLKIS